MVVRVIWNPEPRMDHASQFRQKIADKMICPRCGARMNHHGDKLVYGGNPLPNDTSEIDATKADAPEIGASEIDPFCGGLIVEFHGCPNCGAAASRNA